MSCLYSPEPLSFECVMEIVNDFRAGDLSTTTVRKLLKQIDSGLAAFGMPVTVATDLEKSEVLDRIEELTKQPSTAGINIELIMLLIKLLKEFL